MGRPLPLLCLATIVVMLCYRPPMRRQVRGRKVPRWKIQDEREFLVAAMTELAGNAHLSLEGDLSATKVFQLPGTSVDETAILKRNTTWPAQDFWVVPLETDLIKAIIAAIGGTVPRGILHIQIEKDGQLELGLYDNFGPETSYFGPRLKPEFFDGLEVAGILSRMPYQKSDGTA